MSLRGCAGGSRATLAREPPMLIASTPTSRFLAPLAMLWLGSAVAVSLLVPGPTPPSAERILYIMIPTGWVAAAAILFVFLCSGAYLGTRKRQWDRLAQATTELALLFAGIASLQALMLQRATAGSWWALEERTFGYLLVVAVALACLAAREWTGGRRSASDATAMVACTAVLVGGVLRALFGGFLRVHPLSTARIEAAPAVATQWLCGLAMCAVFAWLLIHRIHHLELDDGARRAR